MNQAQYNNTQEQPDLDTLRQRIADLEQTVADLTDRLQATQQSAHIEPCPGDVIQPLDAFWDDISFPEFFDWLPVPIVLYRTDGMLVAINRRNEQLLNISRDTVLGTFNMYEDREALKKGYLAYFQRAVEGEVVQMPPTSYDTLKAGHVGRPYDPVIWTETIYFPIRDQAGEVRYVGEVNLDVTERMRTRYELRQREEALQHSQALLQGVLDYSPAAIYAKDTEGFMLLVNRRYEEIVQLSKEQIIGKREDDLFPADVVAFWKLNDQHIIATGASLQVDELAPNDDDEGHIYMTTKFPLRDEHGTIYATSGIITDITDRKRTEEALQQAHAELQVANAELQRAARLKDEFLASVSHELRTPLNVILGLSQVLQEEVHGSLTEKQHTYLRSIEESGQDLLKVINSILDLATIEAGKVQLDLCDMPVEYICYASLQPVREMARQKQLTITEELDSKVLRLRADERRLRQMLVHLLNNAIKFTPEGGQISLRVTGDEEQEAVHFTVQDTGIGIAPEHMAQLFKPFVQIDSSLSRVYAGAGLGLVIVARLAELHGGSVTVTSVEGEGSRFTVSLPWKPHRTAEDDSQRPDEVVNRALPSEHAPLILLAEDNEATLMMLQEYLQIRGYRVVVARDGAEAIELARKTQPALILMDIQMPVLDGLEATRHIRTASDFADMPIIAMTALAMPGDRERCLGAGVNAYLSKPIRVRALTEMIEQQLEGQR